jgi:hypothetical protein
MSVLFPFTSGILKEATKQQKWTSLFSEQKWTSFVLLLTTIGRTSVPSRFDASSHGCLNSHSVSYDYSESGDSCDDGDGMPVCVCVIQWTRKNLVRGSCKFCEKLRGAAFLACTSFISTCCHRCVVVEGFLPFLSVSDLCVRLFGSFGVELCLLERVIHLTLSRWCSSEYCCCFCKVPIQRYSVRRHRSCVNQLEEAEEKKKMHMHMCWKHGEATFCTWVLCIFWKNDEIHRCTTSW